MPFKGVDSGLKIGLSQESITFDNFAHCKDRNKCKIIVEKNIKKVSTSLIASMLMNRARIHLLEAGLMAKSLAHQKHAPAND